MKVKILKGIFYTIILLATIVSSLMFLINVYSIEIDETSTATSIKDGDTFIIYSGEEIRLADIDAPERGEFGYDSAARALSNLILDKKVYLDVDDVYGTDNYGRYVCLVYVDHNSTHYLNVNKALLEAGYATTWEHDNEFNPQSWDLTAPKRGRSGLVKLIILSILFGFVFVFLLKFILNRIWSYFTHTRSDNEWSTFRKKPLGIEARSIAPTTPAVRERTQVKYMTKRLFLP
jgi:micrococcal nuclease